MNELWVYVPDVMDRSRVMAARPDAHPVPHAGDLAAAPASALVIVDLGRDETMAALPGLAGRRVIGFGSHVDRGRLAAARAAGCEVVLARSEFFGRLSQWLA